MPLPLYEYSGTVYTDIPPGTVKFPLVTKDGWPISFLEAIHIHVYKTPDQGDSLQELQRPADWNFNAEQTEVVLASPLPAGNALIIRRITPDDNPYVVYAEGTLLMAEQLNRSDQWALCLFQESKDNFANGLGVITGSMIASGTITNTNISDNAEIAVSKLADGNANQVLHTTADGNGVQWRDLTAASTSTAGVVQLSTSTSSTSTTHAATPSAVKTVQDFVQVVSTTANAAMPKAGGTFTGGIVVPSINSGPLAGFRNAIINGNFDVWQRGTSFSNPVSGSYLADRWRLAFDGTGATRTISRESFALGQTDVPGEPSFSLKFNQTVAGSGATGNDLSQRIESVRTFAGQQITISFYAKASAVATLPFAVVQQNFGTGGSPSATTSTTVATNIALTTGWQRFSYAINLPSISGKALGSDSNDHVALVVRLPINTTFNIDIAQVQVEAGPVATPFERRPIGTELALCQRYYCELSGSDTLPVTTSVATGRGYYKLPQTMRATPSTTFSFTGGTGATFSNGLNGGYQVVAHSLVSGFSVKADAEL